MIDAAQVRATALLMQTNTSTTSASRFNISNGFVLSLVFVLSLCVLLLSTSPSINIYDEGFVLFDAWRIAKGEIPYRDFWTQHAPGQFYLLALLFNIFGPSVVVERLLDSLIKAAILTACFGIINQWAPPRYALVGWLFCAIWLAFIQSPGFPVFPAILFCLLSVYLIGTYLSSARLSRIFLAGVCSGAVALFRHDVGFYICVVNVVFLTAYVLTTERGNVLGAATSVQLALFAGGVCVVAVPAICLLLIAVPFSDLWFSLFVVPARLYPPVRALPFPEILPALSAAVRNGNIGSLIELSVYFPLVILAVSAGVLVLQARQKDGTNGANLAFCGLLTLASAALYMKGMIRMSPVHVVQSIIFSIVLLFCLANAVSRKAKRDRLAVAACFLCVLAPSLPALSSVLAMSRKNIAAGTHLLNPNVCMALGDNNCIAMSHQLADAVRYTVANTAPQDAIFVGAGRHDKIFVNDVAFYFLARRTSATKWHQLHPGIQTRADIQAEMISEIESKRPPLVVLNTLWDNAAEPNLSAQSSGNLALDLYLHRHYEETATFGTYHVYKRRADR